MTTGHLFARCGIVERDLRIIGAAETPPNYLKDHPFAGGDGKSIVIARFFLSLSRHHGRMLHSLGLVGSRIARLFL